MVSSTTRLSILLLLALIISGCRASVDEISAQVKSSMQESFDSDPKFSNMHLVVTTVVLVRSHDNVYEGMATVISARQSHDVPITVTADGSNTIWKTQPGALISLMPDDSPHANPYRPGEPSGWYPTTPPSEPAGDESPSDMALRLVKRDYQLKANQSEVWQHGVWSTSRKTDGDSNFIEFNVDYSVPERGMSCRWIILFPLSAPRSYNEVPVAGCAKELFSEVPMSPN